MSSGINKDISLLKLVMRLIPAEDDDENDGNNILLTCFESSF